MCCVDGNAKDYVLKLRKNLYGSKQGGEGLFNHLLKGLKCRGFKQSKANEGVFYKGSTILMVNVHDGIFMGSNQKEIDEIIKSLQKDYNQT